MLRKTANYNGIISEKVLKNALVCVKLEEIDKKGRRHTNENVR